MTSYPISPKKMEQIQPNKYKYHTDNDTYYTIYFPSNKQAISIIIIEDTLESSVTYKTTFTPESLSYITQQFKTFSTVEEIKQDFMTMFSLGMFEIAEKTSTTIQVFLSFDQHIRDFELYKVHEETNDIDRLLLHAKSIADEKIIKKENDIYIQCDNIDKRLSVLERDFDWIYQKIIEKKQKELEVQIQPPVQPIPVPIRRRSSSTCPQSNMFYGNEFEMLSHWISDTGKVKFNMIFRASQFNFSSEEFHIKFDDAVPTLIVAQSLSGARFGGFTKQIWKGENVYKCDPDAFLFSLDRQEKYDILPEEAKNAILCKGEYIAAFGNGDLILFGGGLECYTDFPCSYSCTDRPVEKYAITNGERIFGLKDVEVFQIVYIC